MVAYYSILGRQVGSHYVSSISVPQSDPVIGPPPEDVGVCGPAPSPIVCALLTGRRRSWPLPLSPPSSAASTLRRPAPARRLPSCRPSTRLPRTRRTLSSAFRHIQCGACRVDLAFTRVSPALAVLGKAHPADNRLQEVPRGGRRQEEGGALGKTMTTRVQK